MKLLLTSAGLTNDALVDSLCHLVGKPLDEVTLVFVPTASHGETGDKMWLIDEFVSLHRCGFHSIEITDIAVVDQAIWQESFARADVIYFEGGNTYFLMRHLQSSGVADDISFIVEDTIYIGVSAGSMVTAPDLGLKMSQELYGQNAEIEEMCGLGLVNFYIIPHLNNDYFTHVRKDVIESLIPHLDKALYALDDASGLMVVDGEVTIVGEGDVLVYDDHIDG